ncbi:MAG: CDGSH iron-sulfur domain-containing protein [Gammaproteobacteria bacterium]|nr:CDGSH iron-sulfur domain-containing protein [Gammaproteobacteria bacterium]
MTDEVLIAQKSPIPVDVEKGKTYFWCACGRSKTQPFCDGSHDGTSFKPLPFKAEKDETLYFCGCKKSNTQPFCDGTHSEL